MGFGFFQNFLFEIGVNISSDIIIQTFRRLFRNEKKVDILQVQQALKDLSIQHSSQIESIVNFLTEKGMIEIAGATVTARDKIIYESSANSNIDIKSGTFSKTNSTSINVNKGKIKLSGKASITQEN